MSALVRAEQTIFFLSFDPQINTKANLDFLLWPSKMTLKGLNRSFCPQALEVKFGHFRREAIQLALERNSRYSKHSGCPSASSAHRFSRIYSVLYPILPSVSLVLPFDVVSRCQQLFRLEPQTLLNGVLVRQHSQKDSDANLAKPNEIHKGSKLH